MGQQGRRCTRKGRPSTPRTRARVFACEILSEPIARMSVGEFDFLKSFLLPPGVDDQRARCGANVTPPFSPTSPGKRKGELNCSSVPLAPAPADEQARDSGRSWFQRGTKPVPTNFPSKQVCWRSERDPVPRTPFCRSRGCGGEGRLYLPTFLPDVYPPAFYAYARTPLGSRGARSFGNVAPVSVRSAPRRKDLLSRRARGRGRTGRGKHRAASAAASAGHEDRPDTSADDALRKEQPPKEPLAEEAPDAFPGSLHRKRKEHADGKEGGEHDPKFIRSTREVVDHLDSIRPKVAPYSKELLVGPGVGPLLSPASPDDSLPSTQDEDEDATSQSPESSCVSAQDYWETGGESDLRDESERDEEEEEDFGGGGGGGGGLGVNDSHEERRLNERSFPRSYPQSSRRPRRRTKKRHHSHSPQDSSTRCQSSEDDERSSSYLRSLTSEEEEPTRYDPVPSDVVSCQPATGSVRPSSPVSREPSLGLSELLNAGEPVTSDRGSWGMRESSHCDSWHRTAPRYSRFDDESTMQSNWYRSDEDDIILSPRASEAFKDVGPANGSDDYKTPPGQGAVKILMKNINSIKKKIKRYEEEFESAFGYRPSHSEKMKHKEIKKYMSELSKARKELKQMKDDVAGMMSVPTVFPLSLLRCQESTNPNARPKNTSGTADTIRQVEDRLREKRSASGRPTELTNMNKTEMQEEKTALQKALLYYESVHGRPTTREDRDLARPLYDRYRQVKRIVMRSSSRAKENMVELAPILEHEAMDFTLASPQHRGSLQGDEIEKISLPPSPPSTPPVFESPDTRRGVPLGDLHALPLSELRERKKEARDEKKKLRRALREFEENFERDLGRKVQKEDRGPMEQTYLDYKHAKAKLRLLEALLSKHEPHKSHPPNHPPTVTHTHSYPPNHPPTHTHSHPPNHPPTHTHTHTHITQHPPQHTTSTQPPTHTHSHPPNHHPPHTHIHPTTHTHTHTHIHTTTPTHTHSHTQPPPHTHTLTSTNHPPHTHTHIHPTTHTHTHTPPTTHTHTLTHPPTHNDTHTHSHPPNTHHPHTLTSTQPPTHNDTHTLTFTQPPTHTHIHPTTHTHSHPPNYPPTMTHTHSHPPNHPQHSHPTTTTPTHTLTSTQPPTHTHTHIHPTTHPQ
ncbi:hypothetical protein C7M84_005276 [Penaeus vannamei]|uniref:FAM13A-like domain-containing protein n=1 Tax=Penaeus vannamei TaxID=6689 RepID=A0A423TID1_PENVA|nr:hypothetical protein C7M84_005276 [Penaeus vannamei]